MLRYDDTRGWIDSEEFITQSLASRFFGHSELITFIHPYPNHIDQHEMVELAFGRFLHLPFRDGHSVTHWNRCIKAELPRLRKDKRDWWSIQPSGIHLQFLKVSNDMIERQLRGRRVSMMIMCDVNDQDILHRVKSLMVPQKNGHLIIA